MGGQYFCKTETTLTAAKRMWFCRSGSTRNSSEISQFHSSALVTISTTHFPAHCPYTRLMSTKAVFAEISADEFHALEEKVYRTIEMLKSAREERARAEREASRLRAELVARDDEMAANRAELTRLRREREEVRTRVEKISKQIDALAEEESALQYS